MSGMGLRESGAMDDGNAEDPILIEMIAFAAMSSKEASEEEEPEADGTAILAIACRMAARPEIGKWIEGLKISHAEEAYGLFIEEHGRFAAARDDSKGRLGAIGERALRKLEERGFERLGSELLEDPYQIGLVIPVSGQGEKLGFCAESRVWAERIDGEALARIGVALMEAAEESGLSAAVSLAARSGAAPGVPEDPDYEAMVAEAIGRLRAKEDRAMLDASAGKASSAKPRRMA